MTTPILSHARVAHSSSGGFPGPTRRRTTSAQSGRFDYVLTQPDSCSNGDLELRVELTITVQLNVPFVTEVHNWAGEVGADELANFAGRRRYGYLDRAGSAVRAALAGGTTTSIDRAARLMADGASAALVVRKE
jgi:hypothetical protein